MGATCACPLLCFAVAAAAGCCDASRLPFMALAPYCHTVEVDVSVWDGPRMGGSSVEAIDAFDIRLESIRLSFSRPAEQKK